MTVPSDSDDPGYTPEEITDMCADAYRSGYGQAQADLRRHLSEAMALCRQGLEAGTTHGASPENRQVLRARLIALRWARSLLREVAK